MSTALAVPEAPGQQRPAPGLPGPQASAQDLLGALSSRTLPPLLIVDGTGLLVRCERAAWRAGLTTSAGVPTGALMMFIIALARLVRRHDPGRLAVCWDGPGALAWRREIWPGYKGHHAPAPPGPPGLLAQLMEFCSAAGVPQLMVPGFEADDLMAALVRNYHLDCCLTGRRIVIASDDRDMEQLTAYEPARLTGLSDDFLEDRRDVEARWGVPPVVLAKLHALAGDPSDGIPGLRGTGRVRAARMLREAGLLWSAVLDKIDDPKDREMAVRWRDIIDLVIPVRRPERVTGAKYFRPDVSCIWIPEPSVQLPGFLAQYELTSVLRRLERGGFWRSQA